ncbi:DNA polymerase III subunit beta [Buchnera aphidicola (Taiwanaphis decaspermi)]|uniref:DNA polymerase III subunit beta n=1 Tax=Buchnera aphidicola TaxID=9 RepID=UPI0031B8284F
MRFTIKRETMVVTLQKICISISKNSLLNILKYILVKINSNDVILITTNLDIEIKAKLKANKIYTKGMFLIHARKFLNICRKFNLHSLIDIICYKNIIKITSKNATFTLQTLSVDKFPIINNFEKKISFKISQSKIKYMFQMIYFSMGKNDVRHYLNGIYLKIKNDKIITVATDGYRLSKCVSTIKNNFLKHSVIISRDSILELIKILDNNDIEIKIFINNNNIRFVLNDFIFTSKIINSKFPDYKNIIIKKPNNIIKLECDIIKNALLRASIIAKEKFCAVNINIKKNNIIIKANNKEQDEIKELIKTKNEIKNINFHININYILDILNIIKSKYINLLLEKQISCIQLEKKNNGYLLIYIIMPLKI